VLSEFPGENYYNLGILKGNIEPDQIYLVLVPIFTWKVNAAMIGLITIGLLHSVIGWFNPFLMLLTGVL